MALFAGLLALGGVGCEGAPARSKPWRHAPDPEQVAGVAPRPDEPAAPLLTEKLDKTFRVRLETQPTHLFPLAEPEREGVQVAGHTIYEPLLRYEPPRPGAPAELAPALAESWAVRDNGREIRLLLRAGVTFHDGRPFSAVDAQYTLDWVRSPRLSRVPHLRAALADVEGVEMWGPRDLRIRLRRPNGYVLRALAAVPIVPAEKDTDARRLKQAAPIGTGPYRLATWDRGKRIVLARNEKYWGPPPAVDELVFTIEPDGAKALIDAKQQAIDFLPSLIPAHVPGQLNAPGIGGVFTPVTLRPARFRYVVVNLSRPPFDDVRVREAVALLIDRARIAAEVHGSLARPISGPAWPGGPIDAEGPPPPPTDVARAAALLESAGWTLTREGVREKGGQRLRVALLVTTDSRGDLEREILITAWRKAGIVVEPLPGDPAVLVNRLKAHTFDAALVEWRGHADEDLTPLFASTGANNWSALASPAVDAALAAMRDAPDAATRRTRGAELARLLATEQAILPLTAPELRGVIHGRVKDVIVHDGWIVLRRLRLEPLPEGLP